jgi:putative acetyltransferase
MSNTIRAARFPADRDAVRALFVEYQAAIGVDLCFQGFEAELRDLPGGYAEPRGFVLCAEVDGKLVGCIALRPLGADAAEMKRLYVTSAYRGAGIAATLVQELIRRARDLGYSRICLDTIPGMERAQQLYSSFGFEDIAPYTNNPIAGTRYMELAL